MAEEIVKDSPVQTLFLLGLVFAAGFVSHFLYGRWTSLEPTPQLRTADTGAETFNQTPGQSFPVVFAPLPVALEKPTEVVSIPAREVDKIRGLAGKPARINGRVFRVGHSAKSNTYFLNFGPSRAALTAVIFASAVDLFEKDQLSPKMFDGKEVELQGEIKDHPQYGLEIVIENPSQIKILR
jgi:hypothetical protein